MNPKTKKILGISLLSVLVVSIPVSLAIVFSNKHTNLYEVNENQANQAYSLLKNSVSKKKYSYYDFSLENNNINYNIGSFNGQAEDVNVVSDTYNHQAFSNSTDKINSLSYGQNLNYTVNVSQTGLYEINLDYLIKGDNVLNAPIISVKINNKTQYDEAQTIAIPLLWKGTENKEFPLDSYGDETIPLNERDDTTWQVLEMYDSLYSSSTPLLFKLNSGKNTINIEYTSGTSTLLLSNLKVKAPTKYLSYDSYLANYNSKPLIDSLTSYNAIYYNSKNSSYVGLATEKSDSVTPYSSTKNYLNVISVDSFDDSGQSITYEVDVEKDGLYNLAFHYKNDKNEYDIFRSIYIDGKIPFVECLNYRFESTSSGKWKNEILSLDNKPLNFYFSPGKHLITLKAERNNIYSLVCKVQTIIDHINYFALEILKVAGSEIDKNRTWKLTQYIPETEQYLQSYDVLLKQIMNEGSKYSDKGLDSASLSYIQKAITTLKKLMKKPNELPLYLENLYSGSSSINQLLGTSIATFNDQPLGLDMIYVYGNKKLPRENANIVKRLGSGIVRAYNAYTSDKYDTKLKDDVVNVWINKPLTYINILQQMVDRDFNTKDDKPHIKISMMPDASKLLLSTSAGQSPDVALGIASYTPFDFAVRNAAYDLSSFEDFYEVANRFPAGTLVPFVLNDKFYALPESLDFQVTLYRSDIMDSFEIAIPDTWEDLKDILHVLQQYGMNYYLPTSAPNSTKWFYQTTPMIYQYGGKLYSDDGLTTAINSEQALKGLTLLTDLYKYYSLDSQVNSFYNSFRYGTHPIGAASFSEYLLVKNAAPEIIGKWKIALPLGVNKENNVVDRTFISSGSSAMVFKNTTKAKESWEFLKWWTSTNIQIEYSNRLQSTYGPEYTWLSSNLEAISEAPFANEDKQVIINALNWIIDVPRTPGQYMLERGLSNIWTKVALENKPIGVTIDNEYVTINREITRKMQEFNYLDNNGKVIKEFRVREKDWIVNTIQSHLN